MNNSQLSSYLTQVECSSQAQTIETIQRTLSSQTDLVNGSLAGLGSATLLDELQGLLDIWSEEVNNLSSLSASISVEASKVDASISSAYGVIASASEIIRSISVDGNTCDLLQVLSNALEDDVIKLPITIEQETRRSVGSITLVSYQTLNATIYGNKNEVSKAAAILEEKGSTPEKLSAADVQTLSFRIDPQKIKLNLKYALLIINSIEIDFRKAPEQLTLLRAMFGKRGKNRSQIEFEDFYKFWAEQELNPLSWDAFGNIDGGKEKAEFIHKIRNTVTNINNKVRKALGGTEDFLKARDNTCYINPKLLNLKQS